MSIILSRHLMIRLFCFLASLAVAPSVFSEPAGSFDYGYDQGQGEVVSGDFVFWRDYEGGAYPHRNPGYFGIVNQAGISYGNFWLAKQGGAFDVSSLKVTLQSRFEGRYIISGYRKGVEVFYDYYSSAFDFGRGVPGAEVEFQLNIQDIDLFVVRSNVGNDGFHSFINQVEGEQLVEGGARKLWYYRGSQQEGGIFEGEAP